MVDKLLFLSAEICYLFVPNDSKLDDVMINKSIVINKENSEKNEPIMTNINIQSMSIWWYVMLYFYVWIYIECLFALNAVKSC